MTEGNPERGRKAGRPLSPHLMIYTPHINMVTSILHRLTGSALYLGTVLLAWWLIAAASGPQAYAQVSAVLGSWPGLLILFGYTWALINHMLGGVRHFIWDTGRGFALGDIDLLCWGSLAASAVITAAIWVYALWTTVGTGS